MSGQSGRIAYGRFKNVFDRIDAELEPEFELDFFGTDDCFMIIKYEDGVTFQKCGKHAHEIPFPDLDTLFETAEIDGFRLKDEWENIEYIIVNAGVPAQDFDEFCAEHHLEADG